MLVVHLFVIYAHVNLCHFFSSFWCQGLAAASACGSSWTVPFTFCTVKFSQELLDKEKFKDVLRILGRRFGPRPDKEKFNNVLRVLGRSFGPGPCHCLHTVF